MEAWLIIGYHCSRFHFTSLLHIHTYCFHWQIQVPNEQTPKFCLYPKNENTCRNELIRSWHRTLISSWPQPRAENVKNCITPTCSHTLYLNGTVSHIKSFIEIMHLLYGLSRSLMCSFIVSWVICRHTSAGYLVSDEINRWWSWFCGDFDRGGLEVFFG
jgi:hypothetical protein